MDGFSGLFTSGSLAIVMNVLAKLGLGALLGGAIGFERERSGRPAGIRTHMLLVIGVVLFSEVSKYFGGPDQARIAAQIVTGVGFLGAGT
ncbi:MAG TPA: MgtC/SapB family protein, partial [Fimbriimonadaceae bacterium]|nr:MgtC/SapB family protein [Fimbriimonadaceae bacterium]